MTFPFSPITYLEPLDVGREIQLDARTMEALVFRQIRVSEAFTLRDSAGDYFRASLREAGPRGGAAVVYERMERSPESPLQLSLYCAVLARQRMMLVTQKATELGVVRLQPLFTEHSVPPEGLQHEKAHAWPNQALRAVRQCRRASVPEVRPTVPLAEAVQYPTWQRAEARFYLDDRAAEKTQLWRGPREVVLAVGPEGGWSDPERSLLQASGALPLALGGRVLRSETAVLVGVTLLQHLLGDLQV
ncbi:MAG: RsmE family RNA methyltransferase [Armatimonadota bacterium]